MGIPWYLPVRGRCQPTGVHVCACTGARKHVDVPLSVRVHASVSVRERACVHGGGSGGVGAWRCLCGTGAGGRDVGRARGCVAPRTTSCSGCQSRQVAGGLCIAAGPGRQSRAVGSSCAVCNRLRLLAGLVGAGAALQQGSNLQPPVLLLEGIHPGNAQGRLRLQPVCAPLCRPPAVPAQPVPVLCLSFPISAVLADSWAGGCHGRAPC